MMGKLSESWRLKRGPWPASPGFPWHSHRSMAEVMAIEGRDRVRAEVMRQAREARQKYKRLRGKWRRDLELMFGTPGRKLPPMSREARKIYRKLRINGIGRAEAINVARRNS